MFQVIANRLAECGFHLRFIGRRRRQVLVSQKIVTGIDGDGQGTAAHPAAQRLDFPGVGGAVAVISHQQACGGAEQRRPGLPITIDSRYDLLTYKHLTAATPNEPEVEAAFGQPIGNNLERLHTLGRKLLRGQGLEALLITRGRDGMALFEPRRPPRHLPVFGSAQAVDVTGAGDTVIAAFTLALAAGATFLQAAVLANCAGGIVVMKRGTATVSLSEMTEALRNA